MLSKPFEWIHNRSQMEGTKWVAVDSPKNIMDIQVDTQISQSETCHESIREKP